MWSGLCFFNAICDTQIVKWFSCCRVCIFLFSFLSTMRQNKHLPPVLCGGGIFRRFSKTFKCATPETRGNFDLELLLLQSRTRWGPLNSRFYWKKNKTTKQNKKTGDYFFPLLEMLLLLKSAPKWTCTATECRPLLGLKKKKQRLIWCLFAKKYLLWNDYFQNDYLESHCYNIKNWVLCLVQLNYTE